MGMGMKLICGCDSDLRIGSWSRTVKYRSSEQSSGGAPSIVRHPLQKISSITAALAWNYPVRFPRVNSSLRNLHNFHSSHYRWLLQASVSSVSNSLLLTFYISNFPISHTSWLFHVLFCSKLKKRAQKTFSRTPPRGCWSLSSCLLSLNPAWHRQRMQSSRARKHQARYWITVTSVHFAVTRILKIRV